MQLKPIYDPAGRGRRRERSRLCFALQFFIIFLPHGALSVTRRADVGDSNGVGRLLSGTVSATSDGVVADARAQIDSGDAFMSHIRTTTTPEPKSRTPLMRSEGSRRSKESDQTNNSGVRKVTIRDDAVIETLRTETAALSELLTSAATLRVVASAARATSHKHVARHGTNNTSEGRQTLFVVYSDSSFYETRLKWVMDTWAKALPKSQIMVIGDAEAGSDFDEGLVHKTRCPPHSHWSGACCKYAEAVIVAHEIMQRDPSFSWAYFTDDDSYVRTGAMRNALNAQASDFFDGGIVLGLFGCGEPPCTRGLCAGGGYAANTKALERLVNGNATSFLSEQMQNCGKCHKWADLALTQEMRNRNLEERQFAGVNGWTLTKISFDAVLAATDPEPLQYHYIRSLQQMDLLHRLFTHHAASGARVPLGSKAKALLRPECADYRGNIQCAASSLEVPWIP